MFRQKRDSSCCPECGKGPPPRICPSPRGAKPHLIDTQTSMCLALARGSSLETHNAAQGHLAMHDSHNPEEHKTRMEPLPSTQLTRDTEGPSLTATWTVGSHQTSAGACHDQWSPAPELLKHVLGVADSPTFVNHRMAHNITCEEHLITSTPVQRSWKGLEHVRHRSGMQPNTPRKQ